MFLRRAKKGGGSTYPVAQLTHSSPSVQEPVGIAWERETEHFINANTKKPRNKASDNLWAMIT